MLYDADSRPLVCAAKRVQPTKAPTKKPTSGKCKAGYRKVNGKCKAWAGAC